MRKNSQKIGFTPIMGFTLIELLIVVAIIAILAAIAVPNFLEAQTRSKVSRARADMRTIMVGFEAYRSDNNKVPPPHNSAPAWWGFVPPQITTPVAYLTSLPVMPFFDYQTVKLWRDVMRAGGQGNQPYTYIGNITVFGNVVNPTIGGDSPVPATYKGLDALDFYTAIKHSSFLVYCPGPDKLDTTIWGAPMTYDPSNGTVSFGELFAFGQGDISGTAK